MMVAHGESFTRDATKGSLRIQPDGDILVQTGTAWMKLEASSLELKKSSSCESCGAPLRPECADCAYCDRPNPSAKVSPVVRSWQPDLTTPLVQGGGRFVVEGMIDAQMEQNRTLMGKCDEMFARQNQLVAAQMINAQASQNTEVRRWAVQNFSPPEEKKAASPAPKAKSVVRDRKATTLVKDFEIAMRNDLKRKEAEIAFADFDRQEASDQALHNVAMVAVAVLLPVLIAISIAAG
jgi:hypothetical protein